jgi:DNA-binding winged helix-turn-helix (wHTH) protein
MDKLVEEPEHVVYREMSEEEVSNNSNHVAADPELVVQIEVIRKCLKNDPEI